MEINRTTRNKYSQLESYYIIRVKQKNRKYGLFEWNRIYVRENNYQAFKSRGLRHRSLSWLLDQRVTTSFHYVRASWMIYVNDNVRISVNLQIS